MEDVDKLGSDDEIREALIHIASDNKDALRAGASPDAARKAAFEEARRLNSIKQ